MELVTYDILNKTFQGIPQFRPYLPHCSTHLSPQKTEFTPNFRLIHVTKQLISIISNSIDDNGIWNICFPENFTRDFSVLRLICSIGQHICILKKLNAIIINPIYDHYSNCYCICYFLQNTHLFIQLVMSNINL